MLCLSFCERHLSDVEGGWIACRWLGWMHIAARGYVVSVSAFLGMTGHRTVLKEGGGVTFVLKKWDKGISLDTCENENELMPSVSS